MTDQRPTLDPVLPEIWRLVRGDADVAELERWVYAKSDDLVLRIGERASLELLSADYRSVVPVARVKDVLREYVSRVSPPTCRCMTLPNRAVVDMGADSEEVLASIEQKRSRGEPWWWLWCGECTRCGEWWLAAQEERQNDVICLRRLSAVETESLLDRDAWPTDFDTYESLLRLARDAGRSVRFLEPETSASLRWTVVDLAKARPGIRISELAALLNLDMDVASALAKRAIREDRVVIQFDPE